MYFENLIKRIVPSLKKVVCRLKPGNHPFLSDDDLLQEAMMHLWQDFQEGKLASKGDKYILEGCYFYLKNYLRTRHRLVRGIRNSENVFNMYEKGKTYQLQVAAVRNDPEDYIDLLDAKLLVALIQREGTDKKEKTILSLYAEGLTTRQIGIRLGISHVWVVKLMQRIRHKSKCYVDPS